MSFSPQGLSEFDIRRLIQILSIEDQNLSFISWENFIENQNLSVSNSDQQSSCEDGKHASSEIHICQKHFIIIHTKYKPKRKMHKFYLEESFRKCVSKITIENDSKSHKLIKKYLKYMCIYSRQIIRNLKEFEGLDFNPYIVN